MGGRTGDFATKVQAFWFLVVDKRGPLAGKILKKDSAVHKNYDVKDREPAHSDDDMFKARKQCDENLDEMVASRIADHDAAKNGVLLERCQWRKIRE